MNLESLAYPIPLANGTKITRIQESTGLVILNKKDGVLSTPNSPKDLSKTLLKAKFSKKDEAYVWFEDPETKRFFYICHRLDSPTSGLFVGATNEKTAKNIRELFKNREIHKTYLALVNGIPRNSKGIWKDKLKSTPKGGYVRTEISKAGQDAVTEWKVLEQDKKLRLSLLQLKPLTGRTHQLRVQTSARKLPIVGDRTYGDFKLNSYAKRQWNINRLMLHSHQISIHSEKHKDLQSFQAISEKPSQFFQLFDK